MRCAVLSELTRKIPRPTKHPPATSETVSASPRSACPSATPKRGVRNATVANQDFDEDAIKKQLYPDQETYTREEQRRFEILDSHWDLPIKTMDLDAK